jgi:hypothetical protein
MRVYRRLYIAFDRTSSSTMTVSWYVILFAAARHVNATRRRLYTQLDCYSRSK